MSGFGCNIAGHNYAIVLVMPPNPSLIPYTNTPLIVKAPFIRDFGVVAECGIGRAWPTLRRRLNASLRAA